ALHICQWRAAPGGLLAIPCAPCPPQTAASSVRGHGLFVSGTYLSSEPDGAQFGVDYGNRLFPNRPFRRAGRNWHQPSSVSSSGVVRVASAVDHNRLVAIVCCRRSKWIDM